MSGDTTLPVGACYLWSAGLIALHAVSDGLIAGAYLSVPITLFVFLRKRRDLPFSWTFGMFGLFIVATAAMHFSSMWTIWRPDFWIAGWIKAFTAGISVVTAVAMYPLIPRALTLPSHAAMDKSIRGEDLLRLVVEATPNAMIVFAHDGRIRLINAQVERLFGFSRDEILGQTVETLLPPRFRAAHPAARVEDLLAPPAASLGVGRYLFGLCKDGSEVPLEIGLNAMTTHEGEYVLASIVDITERKAAEELRLINVAIHQELETFCYSISHDLRAPVRAIAGFSEVIELAYGATLDVEGRRLLAVVRSESTRMGELIDALLEFSALNRKSIERNVVDMTTLVKQVCEEQLPPALADKASFDVASLPPARGDRVLLRQVWENLISNALKYSGERVAPRLRVTGRFEGNSTVYTVEDNGVGFDMKYYDKLFGVFQRLHHADEFPGTGVGLAIVQRVITRHGGRVWASAVLHEGASFSFSLPMGDL
jgi:PAS domain S-box-containing protein